MAFLQSKLFAAILGVLLFLLTTAFLIPKELASNLPRDGRGDHPSGTRGPSWTFFNPELDRMIAELQSEKDRVAAKEKQLGELEVRLKAERSELDEATRRIGKLQQEVSRDFLRIKEDEAVNLKKLARMYATMEPASAARIMRELDDTVVVKIMTLMKEGESAPILDTLSKMGEAETRRAAKISENLRLAVAKAANKS
jgi:flagellar motility protein MotE (MotC chaperone)